jgi:tRNA A-37 threonylcarbamoyl transferase component Bud32
VETKEQVSTRASGEECGLVPFTVALDSTSEPLRCERLLRYLPGRRWVGSGVWNDRPVFIKLFQGSSRAKIHWQRETRGARALAERAVPTPALLLSRALGGNRFVNLYELLQNMEGGVAARRRARRQGLELTLLERLVDAVAVHHQAGIVQRDLHLDNFLVDSYRVLTIDGGNVQVMRAPLGRRLALQGLGTLLAQFGPLDDDRFQHLLHRYCAQRGLEPRAAQTTVERARARIGRYRLQKTLEKAYRDSTAFAVEQVFGWRRIWDRALAGDDLRRLMTDPNRYLGQCGEVVKPGNTCTVWRTHADGRSLVVKRYNLKNRRHALGRSWRRSRGSRSWENALRLGLLELPTPRPVALVEQRWGPLRRTTWLVMEWVAGIGADRYFERETVAADQRLLAAADLVALLRLMAAAGLSHGDTKASNYLIAEGCPVIIDLDAMRFRRGNGARRRAHARDMRRFRENWDDQTWERWFRSAVDAGEVSWEGHCWLAREARQ